ncbi:glycosyltransferase [Nostoc sp. 'Peltigera membranacea cyanobiont' 232]|uniref:glycosyltransferase n=1 Tax=Nostoc sp. 'Peltigera membranacea cyanobiont' 232 TaxID=2014531 RepID=UPI001CB9AEEC|nr:glycosyltransferase [Nostoc sp. 'Peltigera membranacea cyanobiont' 232]
MNQNTKKYQLKFVIFSPSFQAHIGGIIALYNLARIIDEAGFSCKIFDMNGLKLPNSIFEKYATEADVNENTVVVYPEIIFGNPLKAKYVVRWILCELGIHCPSDVYTTWGTDDFIYHYCTYNPQKDVKNYNILSPLYTSPALKNHGKSRDGYCHIIRKGHKFHKPLKYIHQSDSLFLDDNLSQEILIEIFNRKEYLISYDPYSYICVMAALCGCIPIIVPITGTTKEEWFKSLSTSVILEESGECELKGIAYGLQEVEYARNTLHEVRDQQEIQIKYGQKSVRRFINDMISIFLANLELDISPKNNKILQVKDVFIVSQYQENIQIKSKDAQIKSTHLVSICIPTYNGEKFIADAINSVLCQTYPNIEIILSDDNSSDTTVEIAKSFNQESSFTFSIIEHSQYGLAPNWNFCISQAKGKYIKFLFQDDLLEPTAIEEMVNLAEQDEEIGLVFSPRTIFSNTSDNSNFLMHHEAKDVHKAWSTLKLIQSGQQLLLDPNILDNPINKIGEPSTVLIRKDVFEKVGLFNSEFCQLVDLEMWLRIMSQYKVGFVNKVLSHFRIHSQQQTRRNVALKNAILLDYQKLFQTIYNDTRYPQATRQQALYRYAALSEQSTELCQLRKQIAEEWLNISDEQIKDRYVSLLGKTHQMLLNSSIKYESLTDEEEIFANHIVKNISQGFEQPKAIQYLLAAMLYRRADQLPLQHDLSGIPRWLLKDYLQFLFSSPVNFQEPGDADNHYYYIQGWINYLHTSILKNTDSPLWDEIINNFAPIANFIPLYFNEHNLKDIYTKRGEIIEFLLKLKGYEVDYEFTDRPTSRKKIRLGVLAAYFSPGSETFAYLPIYEYISRDFEVILYCLNQTGHQLEQYCQSCANSFKLLPQNLAEQVNIIRADDLDILFIATNVTAVMNQICLLSMHRLARIQVTSGGSVVTTGMRHIDYYISGTLTDPSPIAQEQYQEKLVKLEGTAHCFSYGNEQEKIKVKVDRESLGISEETVIFISGANYFKSIPELIDTWAKIIFAVPKSVLVLLPFGPNWSNAYPKKAFVNHLNKVFSKHGIPADQLIVLDPQPVPNRQEVKAYFSIADVYLDSYPFAGTTSLVEPLQVNLPVIARRGNSFRSAMGAAMIQALDVPDLVADSEESYIQLAVTLGTDPELRQQKSAQIKEKMQGNPSFLDSRSYSAKIGGLFQELFSKYLADTLSQNFRLGDINLIIFPDWLQPEELLYQDLASVICTLTTHPDKNNITLLIDTQNISEEEADMLLSSLTMNLLMEEDVDITEGPEISLLGKISDAKWKTLLPRINTRIALATDNQSAIAQAKAEPLPSCDVDSLSL